LKNQVTDFGFSVDLDTGTISNGHMRVVNGVTWNVEFTGQARTKLGGFGPYLSFTIGNAGTEEYNPNYSFSGSMAGMFINNGNQAVTSFAFKNDHISGAGEHLSGTLALGKEDLTVGWGNWNNAFQSWTGDIVTDANTLFASLQLTPKLVIKKMTGSYQYQDSTGSGYGQGLSAGAFSSVDAEFYVDFDTGDISDGHLEVTSGSGPEAWHLHFDGAISNGNVTLTPDLDSMTINTVPVIDGAANLGGAFTGANANGFVGAFEMLDNTTLNGVQGLFTLQKENPQ